VHLKSSTSGRHVRVAPVQQGPFYEEIRSRLSFDFTKSRLIEKLHRLKKYSGGGRASTPMPTLRGRGRTSRSGEDVYGTKEQIARGQHAQEDTQMRACTDLYSWRARFSQVPKDWEQMLELLEMYFFILDKKNLDWESLGKFWELLEML
jgi:hypothetical protein